MEKPEATRYCTTNGKICDEALKKRGSLAIWFDKDMAWFSSKTGRMGAAFGVLQCRGSVQLQGKKPVRTALRQTTGMVGTILEMAVRDWPAPDFSTLSRGQSQHKLFRSLYADWSE